MAQDLLDLVEQEINNDTSPELIREKMLDKGFLKKDVNQAIREVTSSKEGKKSESKKLARLFSKKEVFDRVGYGFVPHQFINILFYLTGASYLWLGLINGARTILSTIMSSLFQEYSKIKDIEKGVISKAGYLYGFSFIGMAFATLAKSVPLFAFFILLGGIGVVTHGDLYQNLVSRYLKREKRGKFLARISHYGMLITAASILLSGWVMDKFPYVGSETVNFMGKTYPVYGYLISFEVTAIAFILSGYFLSHVKEKAGEAREKAKGFVKEYWTDMKIYMSTFLSNRNLFLLITTTVLLGAIQVLGNSYFGVFIYENFENVWLGGFLNVAVIYSVAVLASFLGPWFSKWFNKHTGLAPTLVFGTLLVALMPTALAYNPNLVAIGLANAFSVIGASILGVSQGMLTRKLLHEDERRVYFSVSSMASVIPFLVLVPLGSWFAQSVGLVPLFKILSISLASIVAPLYIILVWLGRNKRL